MRRVQEYGISDLQEFSNISDERIDDVIKDYISRHGRTTGEPFMSGYFHSIGLHVERYRIRADAGSSTSNQRIERLWRDVFRCVCYCHFIMKFYYRDIQTPFQPQNKRFPDPSILPFPVGQEMKYFQFHERTAQFCLVNPRATAVH